MSMSCESTSWRYQAATAWNWQSSDTAFEWNDAILELLHFLR